MIQTTKERSKTDKKNSRGLQSPDVFGKKPFIGVMLCLISILIFGLMAYYVQQKGALVQWDISMENHMHQMALNSSPWIKNIMLAGYYIGMEGYMAIGAVLALYFLFKKFWEEFFMVVVLYAGQSLIFYFLTKYFARPRPQFTENIGALIKYPSFPSGHMMSSVICFGLIAYFLVPKISSRLWKAMIIIFSVLMVLFIGYSRFFMGAHYLTDLVAGLAVGVAWTSLAIMLIELLFKKGGHKNVKEKETYSC
ncbi:MAG TPA: phosphatase PAP2 family protein [Ruminiclostridium sp.]